MPHDHAESQRERERYEATQARADLRQAKTELIVACGALREIAAYSTGTFINLTAKETAQHALEAIQKIRKPSS